MQRNVLLLALVLAILLVCVKVRADDTFLDRHEVSIGWSFYTIHFSGEFSGDGDKYNNNNNIIALSIDQWFVATFNNSHYDRSYSAGYTFRTPKWQPVGDDWYGRANVMAGIVYGYDDQFINVGGFTPGIIPSVEVGYKMVSLDTIVIPIGSGVLSCILKVTF